MTSHIVHTLLTPDGLLWYGLQFLNQVIDKVLLMYIPWIMRSLSNTSRNNVSGMFYWGKVWKPGWPVHHTDTFVIKKGHGHPSCVGTCNMHVQYIASK